MMVDPTHWDPPSYKGLCSFCDIVVYKSNPNYFVGACTTKSIIHLHVTVDFKNWKKVAFFVFS
jgi:hypothetical protein